MKAAPRKKFFNKDHWQPVGSQLVDALNPKNLISGDMEGFCYNPERRKITGTGVLTLSVSSEPTHSKTL